MNDRRRWLPVGILCLAFLLIAACQRTDWESNIAAGLKAYRQGRDAKAEKLFLAALGEADGFGPQDPRLATSLNNLATVYHSEGKYAEAEPLYRQSLAIIEKILGPEHRHVATSLENYAALLRKTKRNHKAAKMEARAKAIRMKHAQENPRGPSEVKWRELAQV